MFLAADPGGTDRAALDQEARSIQVELERSGYRDCFRFETRWAAEPLDLLRELRRLRPTVVHFSGRGSGGGTGEAAPGLLFHGSDGEAQVVSAAALDETFGAVGASVRLVVLAACYTEPQAEALLAHVDCVVGVSGAFHAAAARAFAIGFYGGLGERESVAAAYRQGCAATSLEGVVDVDRPQLKIRAGVDASGFVLADESPPDADRGSARHRTSQAPGRARWPWLIAPAALGALGALGFLLYRTTQTKEVARPAAPLDAGVSLDGPLAGPLAAPRPPDGAVPRPPDGMVLIPEATFEMGSTDDEIQRALAGCRDVSPQGCNLELYQSERPARRMYVAAFFLDRYERTNAEVAAWLSAAPGLRFHDGWVMIGDAKIADLDRVSSPLRKQGNAVVVASGKARLPATYVTHRAARAFCRARGLDLPSEVQWERAARGPQRRAFPWGDDRPSCDTAVFARDGACARHGATPVEVDTDTRDRTPEGVLHLGGNVAEWVIDRFAPYAACSPCADVVNDAESSLDPADDVRVFRGGAYLTLAEALRAARRWRWPPDVASAIIGFRCATPVAKDAP